MLGGFCASGSASGILKTSVVNLGRPVRSLIDNCSFGVFFPSLAKLGPKPNDGVPYALFSGLKPGTFTV